MHGLSSSRDILYVHLFNFYYESTFFIHKKLYTVPLKKLYSLFLKYKQKIFLRVHKNYENQTFITIFFTSGEFTIALSH